MAIQDKEDVTFFACVTDDYREGLNLHVSFTKESECEKGSEDDSDDDSEDSPKQRVLIPGVKIGRFSLHILRMGIGSYGVLSVDDFGTIEDTQDAMETLHDIIQEQNEEDEEPSPHSKKQKLEVDKSQKNFYEIARKSDFWGEEEDNYFFVIISPQRLIDSFAIIPGGELY